MGREDPPLIHLASLTSSRTYQQRDRPADEPDAADRDPAEEVQGVPGQHPVGDEDAQGEEAAVREDLHAQGSATRGFAGGLVDVLIATLSDQKVNTVAWAV